MFLQPPTHNINGQYKKWRSKVWRTAFELLLLCEVIVMFQCNKCWDWHKEQRPAVWLSRSFCSFRLTLQEKWRMVYLGQLPVVCPPVRGEAVCPVDGGIWLSVVSQDHFLPLWTHPACRDKLRGQRSQLCTLVVEVLVNRWNTFTGAFVRSYFIPSGCTWRGFAGSPQESVLVEQISVESSHLLVGERKEAILQEEQTASCFQPVLVLLVVETVRQLLTDHLSSTSSKWNTKRGQSFFLAPPTGLQNSTAATRWRCVTVDTCCWGWETCGLGRWDR